MSKRQTKQGQQYKKNRKETTSQAKQTKSSGLSTSSKIIITVFAVLMALSMMLPSLAGLFGKDESSSSISSIEDLDERYSELADSYEQKIAKDPNDMESVRSLASLYMNWGFNVSYLATIDAETSHANELFAKAIALYDSYIASNPEDASNAKVDRALCLLYSGETSNALNELESITQEDPDNALAWANLGYLYELNGDTDAAVEAYQQAIATDPDDEQGAKSYASSRMLALNGNGSESLPETLRDLTDTSV